MIQQQVSGGVLILPLVLQQVRVVALVQQRVQVRLQRQQVHRQRQLARQPLFKSWVDNKGLSGQAYEN